MMQQEADSEAVSITCGDGFALGGTLFRGGPADTDPDTVVIMHGATAVPQRFYRRFARFLQSKGWTVLTYDYRGIGASRPESLKGFAARASDWGLLDIPATLDWVLEYLHPRKLYFVGHSAGGQQAGLLPQPGSVDAMVTVSAQSGYWRLQGGWEKLNVFLMMTTVVPIVARMFGYLPWSRLAAGEDLPEAAAIQWARWCRSPNYLLDDPTLPVERYRNFNAPVLAYSIDDDDWGTARATDAMMSAYPNVERRHLVPREYDLKKVGHMGFFRPESAVLWEEAYHWLLQEQDPRR